MRLFKRDKLKPLKQAIKRGDDCDKLFILRNEIRRNGATQTEQDEMNNLLRNIGCYTIWSHRNGQ